jgi:hypothetical protein
MLVHILTSLLINDDAFNHFPINLTFFIYGNLFSYIRLFYELIDCTFFYELYFSYLNSEYMLHYLDKLY